MMVKPKKIIKNQNRVSKIDIFNLNAHHGAIFSYNRSLLTAFENVVATEKEYELK